MAPGICSMAECSTTAADIGCGCSESEWCGCGLLRDSDARRLECQGKTRTEFSAATVGVDLGMTDRGYLLRARLSTRGRKQGPPVSRNSHHMISVELLEVARRS